MVNQRRVASAIAVLLSVVASSADAQSVLGMLGNDIKNSVGDAWGVWTSPLRARPRDWLITAGAVAAPTAVSPWDDEVDRWALRKRDDGVFHVLKPFREGGVAFSGRTITPIALGALAVGLVTKNETLQEGLFGCVTSYGASSLARNYVLYPIVARTRPDSGRRTHSPPAVSGDQYNFSFPGSGEWGEHSFPGGHVANVAACAEFLTGRFSMGVFEPLPWLVVGGVAVSRSLDRRHWASDQVLGIIFGYAVGKEVALRSHRRAARDAQRDGERNDDGDRKRIGEREDRDSRGRFFIGPSANGTAFGWRRAF